MATRKRTKAKRSVKRSAGKKRAARKRGGARPKGRRGGADLRAFARRIVDLTRSNDDEATLALYRAARDQIRSTMLERFGAPAIS